ncbi:MAG: type II toxin-antitoxin system RelE/ParE family toxin [Candidatus Sericytochromatia bacterium]|jgi:proteic killer suppression protein
MIKSFANKETEQLFHGKTPRRLPPSLHRIALRKLLQIHAAVDLDFLKVPPGNKLEALKGNRKGQYSIRINDQWRICFVWIAGHADAVEIVDYH